MGICLWRYVAISGTATTSDILFTDIKSFNQNITKEPSYIMQLFYPLDKNTNKQFVKSRCYSTLEEARVNSRPREEDTSRDDYLIYVLAG